ncbi:YslB family protein, partial [Lactobacillus nasalidis]
MSEHNEHVYFVNQLYRDFLLPTILGGDTPAILYWAGKRITRKYALSEMEDLIEFFKMAEFGDLTVVKERRASIIFTLSGQPISDRLASGSREFSLESGMIAEAVEQARGRSAEAEISI